jgi:hypothetical protein
MYQLIITYRSHTYSIFGDSADINDYPNIPVGAYVWIPATGDLYYTYGPRKGFDLDGSEEEGNPTSIFGKGIIGNIIFGEE